VRLKRHDARGKAARAGPGSECFEEGAMTPMHTIEIADGQGTGGCSAKVGRASEYVH
jgi:hypothetical protein